MHFVYVLKSLTDGRLYTGYTQNLEERLREHNEGEVTSTKHRRPFEIVYYEASRNQRDALHREKYLKTSYGKRYLKSRIKQDLGP
jgi:putative endonuclease